MATLAILLSTLLWPSLTGKWKIILLKTQVVVGSGGAKSNPTLVEVELGWVDIAVGVVAISDNNNTTRLGSKVISLVFPQT